MLIKLLFLGLNTLALFIAISAFKALYVPNREMDAHLESCISFVMFAGFMFIGFLFLYSVIQLFI